MGAILSTLGVVLPSFIIILVVSMFLKNLLQYRPVKAILAGVKPVIVALMLATSITLMLSTIFGIQTIGSEFQFNYWGVVIFALVVVASVLYKKSRKKAISPILLILLSGVIGIVFYGIL